MEILYIHDISCTSGIKKRSRRILLIEVLCSTEVLPDQKECREVNCLNMPTPWRVQLFLHYNETDPNVLKSVRVT